MKHRRRNNTQTILRKSTGTKTSFSSPKKKKSKKPLFYFFLLIFCTVLVYLYKGEIGKFVDSFSRPSITEANRVADTQQNDSPAIPSDDSEQTQYYSPIEKKIQLEILNGCGEEGVAKKLTDLLRKTKYDIVNSGNYMQKGKINWNVNETKIIDQINKQADARELADLMGILYSNVEIYDNPSPISDITVVIGKDYKTLSIFQ